MLVAKAVEETGKVEASGMVSPVVRMSRGDRVRKGACAEEVTEEISDNALRACRPPRLR